MQTNAAVAPADLYIGISYTIEAKWEFSLWLRNSTTETASGTKERTPERIFNGTKFSTGPRKEPGNGTRATALQLHSNCTSTATTTAIKTVERNLARNRESGTKHGNKTCAAATALQLQLQIQLEVEPGIVGGTPKTKSKTEPETRHSRTRLGTIKLLTLAAPWAESYSTRIPRHTLDGAHSFSMTLQIQETVLELRRYLPKFCTIRRSRRERAGGVSAFVPTKYNTAFGLKYTLGGAHSSSKTLPIQEAALSVPESQDNGLRST